MSNRRRLLTSSAGIAYDWQETERGGANIIAVADVAPILERNKAMATHNDGYSKSREMRRVASIPLILLQKWKNEEGWDPWNTSDPDVQRKLALKLDDPEYQWLRTAPGRVGDSWRKSI
jgi:hypothetical protein